MSNPLEDFLEEYAPGEKVAFGFGEFAGGIGKGVVQGLGAAAAAGVVAGGGMAAAKIYNAATKSRDFRNMLEFNPDLAAHHENNPRMFNQMYSSLRAMNPSFSRDPLVAGTFMRQMVDAPETAGGKLTEALKSHGEFETPLSKAFDLGISNAGGGFKNKKPKPT